MNKLKYAIGIVLLATFAVAAVAEKTDKVNSPVPQLFPKGIYVGDDATNPSSTKSNKVTKILGASSTINFPPFNGGESIESSAITVTGARAGDPCFVGPPAAAGALKASYSCYVSASDAVKIRFTSLDTVTAQCTLGGQSPATCTVSVSAGSFCMCGLIGSSAAIAAKGCAVAVASTTATVTSANAATEVATVNCAAPVDPASAVFFVRVISSQ